MQSRVWTGPKFMLTTKTGFMDPYSNIKQDPYEAIKPEDPYSVIKQEVASPRDSYDPSYYGLRAGSAAVSSAQSPGAEGDGRHTAAGYQYSYPHRSSYDAATAHAGYGYSQTHPSSYAPTYTR